MTCNLALRSQKLRCPVESPRTIRSPLQAILFISPVCESGGIRVPSFITVPVLMSLSILRSIGIKADVFKPILHCEYINY